MPERTDRTANVIIAGHVFTYDLDDPGDLQVMYQTVLNQAATAEDLRRRLDADSLRRVWQSLWLPARLRALWQARFSELARPPQALAG